MSPCHLEWHLWLIQIYIRPTSAVVLVSLRYVTGFRADHLCLLYDLIRQPSTCNTYRAIEQANSNRPHLDVTGIGATACCHGFFVPTSVVDFHKGEKCVQYNFG